MTITPDIAPKGSNITCENGHYICTAAVDLRRMRRSGPENFCQWHFNIREPDRHQSLPLRCTCGAPYLKGGTGQCVHLDGFGWWPRNIDGEGTVTVSGAGGGGGGWRGQEPIPITFPDHNKAMAQASMIMKARENTLASKIIRFIRRIRW